MIENVRAITATTSSPLSSPICTPPLWIAYRIIAAIEGVCKLLWIDYLTNFPQVEHLIMPISAARPPAEISREPDPLMRWVIGSYMRTFQVVDMIR
jgi:hypothetical protein